MPLAKNLIEAAGNATQANYIEDVFSTWLSTGDNSSSRAIVNGIDLATKGGLVWGKRRDSTGNHQLYDTARGVNKYLLSNDTGAQGDISPDGVNAFNTNGFSTGVALNTSPYTYAYWTFRKQPKFFDVVTYTGNGTSNRNISHAIGGTVGCVIVKRTDSTGEWMVYHQGSNSGNQFLNQAAGGIGSNVYINGVSSTTFTVSSVANTNGASYVAHVYAHNAGGFGLTGTENVITCGSYTGDGTATGSKEINLGFEPQFLIVHGNGDWLMADNMRCMNYAGDNVWILKANTSGAEAGSGDYFRPTATGFKIFSSNPNANESGTNYIYIAIRRGPMKVPTDGTKVYATSTSDTVNNPEYISNFPVDMEISTNTLYGGNRNTSSRLLQGTYLFVNTTAAESAGAQYAFDYNNGWARNAVHDSAYRSWMFQRAPSFFDEVCYTGNDVSGRTLDHNLKATPELMIVKTRSGVGNWAVYTAATAATNVMYLNTTNASFGSSGFWNNTAPTSSVFSIGNNGTVNSTGTTYVAYLFATCAGVQYINSYVGDGTTGRTINCGFTGGARFVCIKATSTTGSWWTFDSARGIVTNSDPALQLNSTAAEVTSADAIDTAASGFIVNQEATCSLNASGVTYLVWAIA